MIFGQQSLLVCAFNSIPQIVSRINLVCSIKSVVAVCKRRNLMGDYSQASDSSVKWVSRAMRFNVGRRASLWNLVVKQHFDFSSCCCLGPQTHFFVFISFKHYVDLELGVFTGSGGLKHHLGSEPFALQLLVQVPVGGPFVQPDSTSPVRPSLLVRAGHAFAKRLETVWFLLSGLSQLDIVRSFAAGSTFAAVLSSLTRTLPILCYLNLLFDVLTSDVQVGEILFLITLLVRTEILIISIVFLCLYLPHDKYALFQELGSSYRMGR